MSAHKGVRHKTTVRFTPDVQESMKSVAKELGTTLNDYLEFAHKRLVANGVWKAVGDAAVSDVKYLSPYNPPRPSPPNWRGKDALPAISTLWRHYNGNTYIVVGYSNKNNNEKHPLNILHRNIYNGELYSREATDWARSFQPWPRERYITRIGANFHITLSGIFIGMTTPLTECENNAWRIAEEVAIDSIKEHIETLMKERGESGL